jgi:hypothetical protein
VVEREVLVQERVEKAVAVLVDLEPAQVYQSLLERLIRLPLVQADQQIQTDLILRLVPSPQPVEVRVAFPVIPMALREVLAAVDQRGPAQAGLATHLALRHLRVLMVETEQQHQIITLAAPVAALLL